MDRRRRVQVEPDVHVLVVLPGQELIHIGH
jgi:hypothetical protein